MGILLLSIRFELSGSIRNAQFEYYEIKDVTSHLRSRDSYWPSLGIIYSWPGDILVFDTICEVLIWWRHRNIHKFHCYCWDTNLCRLPFGVVGSLHGKLRAVFGVELWEPSPVLCDGCVFLHQQWFGAERLVVPYHYVAIDLSEEISVVSNADQVWQNYSILHFQSSLLRVALSGTAWDRHCVTVLGYIL